MKTTDSIGLCMEVSKSQIHRADRSTLVQVEQEFSVRNVFFDLDVGIDGRIASTEINLASHQANSDVGLDGGESAKGRKHGAGDWRVGA